MIRLALIVGVVCMVSACGSLEVKVDILDPQVVKSQQSRDYVRRNLPAAVARGNSGTATTRLVEEWRSLGESSRAEWAAGRGNSDCVRLYSETALPAAEKLQSTLEQLKDSPYANKNVSEMTSQEVERLAGLLTLQYQYWKRLDKSAEDCAKALKKKPAAVASRTGGGTVPTAPTIRRNDIMSPEESIRSSPVAYWVANASADSWKEAFNLAKGAGQLGNSDIAIKLSPSGQFTVKGLTFDPSDTVRLISKVSVQVLANYTLRAGLPLGTLGTTAPAASSTSPTDASAAQGYVAGAKVVTLQGELETIRAKMVDQMAAVLTVANAVIRAVDNLGASPSDAILTSQAEAAFQVLEANKSRVSPAVQ